MQLEIKAIKKEAGGVFSLLFSKPENFIFYPGQYLDIGRILSISSSPTEDFVMLTYKTGISSFKKMLEKVKIGDLYSNSDEDFIFKEELDEWVKQYPKLKIHYMVTSKDGHLTKEKLRSIINFPLSIINSIFYLAGPPSLVDDFENILLSLGIDETSIRTDRFDGL